MKSLLALLPLLLSSALAGGAGPAAAPPHYLEVLEGPLTCSVGARVGPKVMRISVQEWTGTTFKALAEFAARQGAMPQGRAVVEGKVEGDYWAGLLTLTNWHWLLQPQGLNLANLSTRYIGEDDYSIKLTFDPPQMGCTGAKIRRVK